MHVERLTRLDDTPVVSLEELRAQLNIPHEEDDALLARLESAAVSHIEHRIEQSLPLRKHRYTANCWPHYASLRYGPVRRIDSVTYVNADGLETQLMADRWSARHGHGNDRLVLVDHASLPSLQTNRLDAVSIEYVAGFGVVDANQPVFPYTFPIVFGSGREFVNSVPDDLRHAIALLVSHWYENRESTVVGTIASQVPQTVDALIQPHRVLGY